MKGDSGGPLVARFGTIFVQKKTGWETLNYIRGLHSSAAALIGIVNFVSNIADFNCSSGKKLWVPINLWYHFLKIFLLRAERAYDGLALPPHVQTLDKASHGRRKKFIIKKIL